MLKSACKKNKPEGSLLFGPAVHKAISDREDTLSAFSKAEKTSLPQAGRSDGNFVRRCPTSTDGGRPGKFSKSFHSSGQRIYQPRDSQPRGRTEYNLSRSPSRKDAPRTSTLRSNFLHKFCPSSKPSIINHRRPSAFVCQNLDPWILEMVFGYQLDFSSYPPLGKPRQIQPPLVTGQRQGTQAEIKALLEKQDNSSPDPPIQSRFLQQCLYGTKERWRVEADHQFKRPQQVYSFASLQDGEHLQPERCHPARRLDVQTGKFYQFKTLPFGLTSAPYVFTKLLRPIASLLRQQGLRIVIYLDDMLLMASSERRDEPHNHTPWLLLGFVLNHKKCITEPTQLIEFLGFIVDSRNTTLSLSLLIQTR